MSEKQNKQGAKSLSAKGKATAPKLLDSIV